MPTIGAFFDSDAFIRGLQGPFGCLSADTEFLTPAGWKRMDAFQEGDWLLQWHPEGASWTAPSRYIVEAADELLLFDNKTLKMALSPEHRVPHWDYRGNFKVATAAQIAASTTRKTIPTTFKAPEDGLKLSDAGIRYQVMMQADGWLRPQGRQVGVTVRKERKKQRVREILSLMEIQFTERCYEGRPTETNFIFYPPDRQKHFPVEWYAMSYSQLEVVMDEIQYWDSLFGYDEARFFSTNKPDIDFIQFASHATGRRAVIRRKDYQQEGWKPGYTVYIRQSDNSKNRASIREMTEIRAIPTVDGKKYCFEVPTGFFVARYQDTIFVTGNSGKSSACAIEIAQRALKAPPGSDGVRRSRWAVVRNTSKQLEDTTERTVLQWLVPQHVGGNWVPSKHNYTIRGLRAPGDDRGAEIEIMFRALDRDDQIRDLLSLELTGAWINEAREINWAVFNAIQGRLGRFPRKADTGPYWFGLWADTNPPDVDSDWYKFFEKQDHADAVAALEKIVPGLTVDTYRKLFRQPSGRSPQAENLANLAEGYYQRLAIGKDPEWIKVYIDGEYGFTTDGKPVWPEYVDQIHCPEEKEKWPKPTPALPIVRSWDFGLTPACIFSQITSKGQWIVFDELISTSMGADKFSDEVLEHSARYYPRCEFWDVGDPAGMQRAQTDETTCFQILHAKGIAIEPGLQTLEIRLESVRKPLRTLIDGRPQFVLHRRCETLRRGMMGGYHFRKMRISGERYTASPEKDAYSHPCDALSYAGTRLFGAALYRGERTADERGYDSPSLGRRSSITGY
jgi:hypothetical protein